MFCDAASAVAWLTGDFFAIFLVGQTNKSLAGFTPEQNVLAWLVVVTALSRFPRSSPTRAVVFQETLWELLRTGKLRGTAPRLRR